MNVYDTRIWHYVTNKNAIDKSVYYQGVVDE